VTSQYAKPPLTAELQLEPHLNFISFLHIQLHHYSFFSTPNKTLYITMGWFSSNEKSAAATHPINPDVTTLRGSGAEQDRYGEHFSQIGHQAGEKIREGIHDLTHARGSGAEQDRYGQHLGIGQSGYNAAKAEAQSGYDKAKSLAERALHAKGDGAEQDRYGAHFSTGGLDPVRAAALDIISSKGDVGAASRHGLGHDGWERAKILAAQKGTGAEQVQEARISTVAIV
jgi:hypothetical protein